MPKVEVLFLVMCGILIGAGGTVTLMPPRVETEYVVPIELEPDDAVFVSDPTGFSCTRYPDNKIVIRF